MNKKTFSVIEFVVAATLTVSLVASVSLSTSSIQRNMSKNRVKTQITFYAQNILETARAFNCGSEVNADMSSNLLGESSRIKEACTRELITKGSNLSFDPSRDCYDNGGYEPGYKEWRPCLSGNLGEKDAAGNYIEAYKLDSVIFSSQWMPLIDEALASNAVATTISCNSFFSKLSPQPSLLRNSIKILYSDPFIDTKGNLDANKRFYEFTELISYPNNFDIYEDNSNLLVVLARSNQKLVTLASASNNNDSITREGVPCTDNGSERFAAVFPYLSTGEYLVADENGTGQILSVGSNSKCFYSIGGGVTCS